MASQGWQPALALMPELWTQLWQGQLSEERNRPANLPGAEETFWSDEHAETLEQDEEHIEE